MQTRTIQASTLSEAMQLVRQTCGEEAIIVGTKHVDGQVYIDVALENDPTLASPRQALSLSTLRESQPSGHLQPQPAPPRVRVRSLADRVAHFAERQRPVVEPSDQKHPPSEDRPGESDWAHRRAKPAGLPPVNHTQRQSPDPHRQTDGSFASAMASVLNGGGSSSVLSPHHRQTKGDSSSLERVLSIMERALWSHDITDDICARLLAHVKRSLNTGPFSESISLLTLLENALSHCLDCHPVDLGGQADHERNILVLVGPPGAGKTVSCVKLASMALLEGKTVTIIDTDGVRMGASQQLNGYADRLGIPVCRALDGTGLQRALYGATDADVVLVDTPAVNPFEPEELARLVDLCSLSDLNVALVLETGRISADTAELIDAFSPLRVSHLMVTKIDIARRLGGLLVRPKIKLSHASLSPRIADGMTALSATIIARLLLVNAGAPLTLTRQTQAAA